MSKEFFRVSTGLEEGHPLRVRFENYYKSCHDDSVFAKGFEDWKEENELVFGENFWETDKDHTIEPNNDVVISHEGLDGKKYALGVDLINNTILIVSHKDRSITRIFKNNKNEIKRFREMPEST